jgi:hypothetical protein
MRHTSGSCLARAAKTSPRLRRAFLQAGMPEPTIAVERDSLSLKLATLRMNRQPRIDHQPDPHAGGGVRGRGPRPPSPPVPSRGRHHQPSACPLVAFGEAGHRRAAQGRREMWTELRAEGRDPGTRHSQDGCLSTLLGRRKRVKFAASNTQMWAFSADANWRAIARQAKATRPPLPDRLAEPEGHRRRQ